MELRRGQRIITVGVRARRKEREGVEKTTNQYQRDRSIFRDPLTVMETKTAFTTTETRETGVTTTAKLFAHSVRGNNGSRQCGCEVALTHSKAVSVIGRNTEITYSLRIVWSVVSHLQGRGVLTALRKPTNVPEQIEAIGGTSHGATIHVCTRRSIGSKELIVAAKLIVVRGPIGFHGVEAKVQSVECSGSRINGIDTSSQDIFVREVGETGRAETTEQVVMDSVVAKRNRVIVRGGIRHVITK
jgi:hypothetical protein